ncbi:MAG: sulfatase-like hydrolase/transferase [Candidatus Aminicenantes bacterium]|nr:sulfatase-like hydrolase/transferase [Candidatus Aminicenantes bacterium]
MRAAALGAFALILVVRPGRRRVEIPGTLSYNVLLITLDTTRADHLGCYGYASAKTPNLDRLAREGIRFTRVCCPAPLTLPSHASIMTGLYPVTHGVRNNGHDLPSGIRTLAGILKAQGYSTAAFVSSFSVDSRFGLDRGFDVYDDTFRAESPFKTQNAERRAEETFARFSRWLENNGKSRFFGWVHYFDPHLPYDPPSPYKEEFEGNPYDGEIAYMDRYVGAVLDRLKELGVLERTIIVIAGDHGEGLGDKVELGHGIFLYEETLKVPLIVHSPSIFPRAQVIENEVRLIDVAPTILETVGLKGETAGMTGQSLIPWLRGKSGKDLDSLVETFYPRENFGWSELVGLVSGRWKYIQSPRPELYDLRDDPGEREDLIASSAGKAAELRKTLEQELLVSGAGGSSASGRTGVKPEDQERLRSLGYVNFAPAGRGASLPDPKDKIPLLKLIQQAQAYELEENYAEAENVYLRVLEDIPDSPAGYVNLALAQARQKKFDRAIETLNKGVARIPDSEIVLVRLGHTHLVTGRSREAFETMNKVLSLNPRNVDALTVCAGILDTEGRKNEARAYYDRALAVEPESRYLRMSYAGNLASGGRLREAIEVYKKLIDDYPEEQAFYQYIGIAHSYLGEYGRAIYFLERALAIGPTPTGYFNLAVAHEKSGNVREAVKYFKLYLDNSLGESESNIRKARAELERLEKGS